MVGATSTMVSQWMIRCQWMGGARKIILKIACLLIRRLYNEDMNNGLPFSTKTNQNLTIYYSDKKGTDRLLQTEDNQWFIITPYVICKLELDEVRYLLADWKLNH